METQISPPSLVSLTDLPDGLDVLRQTIARLDRCFLNGFVGSRYEILSDLPAIFQGTPLLPRIQEATQALSQNIFTEGHFVALAAARSALQGALYDALRAHALVALGRTAPPESSSQNQTAPTQTHALLDSARHWLMEIALAGFARLDSGTVGSFSPTLSQLRADAATQTHSVILTGFLNELLTALPIHSADEVPLMRWCDLWCQSMLSAVGLANVSAPESISGTLYPLGVELRQHARAASMVFYGALVVDETPQLVRQTWTASKSSGIQGDDVWLLFADAQIPLRHLAEGKSLLLNNMPMLPSGDLLWKPDAAKSGKKYKFVDIVQTYCTPGQPIFTRPVRALDRHHIHIAEPVALTDYQIVENDIQLSDGTKIALDIHRAGLAPETVAATSTLFGMLRYDGGAWSIQVVSAWSEAGGLGFVGQSGAELLKKPPKSSALTTLQERASRLLRKRANT